MKYTLIIILSFFFFGISQTSFAQTKTMDQFTVKVHGLGCPFCAYGLEKKFKELKGIKKLKIEFETGTMTFKYPADKKMSTEQVAEQVDKAAYTATDVMIERADGKVEKKTFEVPEEEEE